MQSLKPRPIVVALLVLGGLVLVTALGLMIVFVPTWLAYNAFSGVPGTPTQEQWAVRVSDERRSVLWIVGGLLAIVGLIYTALRHRLGQANLELQRDANRTDRYASAIEQLGSEKLDIRLGGIYALERIALDSQRDRGPIGEVLSAFVREHATELSAVPDKDIKFLRPATDVQAVLTVLGRRPDDGTHPPANLVRAYLRGASLHNANFQEANFQAADLQAANLAGANLRGARFVNTKLQRSIIYQTDLREADLDRVHLEDAWIIESRLDGASLDGATLRNARVKTTTMVSTVLTSANLTSLDLWDCVLVRARFDSADLSYASLKNVDLSTCDFTKAILTRTNLTGSVLDLSTLSDEQRAQLQEKGPSSAPAASTNRQSKRSAD